MMKWCFTLQKCSCSSHSIQCLSLGLCSLCLEVFSCYKIHITKTIVHWCNHEEKVKYKHHKNVVSSSVTQYWLTECNLTSHAFNASTENTVENTKKVFSISNVQFLSSAKLIVHTSALIAVRIRTQALNTKFMMENTFKFHIIFLFT